MNDIKTAAAYIRVSTDDQVELSPDSQIKVIMDYAKSNGYIVPQEYIFRDDGISGRRADKRPAFNEMIATAKQSPAPFSAVLLWKFSRFARNQEESIFYKSMLRKNSIDIISVSEPIIDGPFGTLIERIIEWSDEYYSIRLSGEVRRGMTEKVSRGGAVSVPPFGYKMENKKLVIEPTEAQLIKKIFSDYLSGRGSLPIAADLNSLGIKTHRGGNWENRTVDYILQNPVYIGKIRWNPKRKTRRNYDDKDIMIVDGQHEPIIDSKVFELVQKKIAEQKAVYRPYLTDRKNGDDYMLKGLVKCSNCGSTLAMLKAHDSLQCVSYTHGKCSVSHCISLKKLNKLVLSTLEYAIKTGDFILDPPKNESTSVEIDITALIQKEKAKLKRIKDAYEAGIYTLEEYKESRTAVEKQMQKLSTQAEKVPSDEQRKKELMEKHKNIIPQLTGDALTEKEKNELLRTFVSRIKFSRSNCSITLFFY